MIEIPLNSNPEQKFKINIKGSTYDIRVILNSRTGNWSLSISQGGIDLVNGIIMVGGADLVKQFNLDFKNMFIINLENSKEDATKTNLGTGSKLFILTEEEIQSVQTV